MYGSALEPYDATVADLRLRFDADPNEQNLENLQLANDMWAGYTRSIDALIEANTRLTLEIADPELRSSATMLDALSREVNDLGVMVRTAIISSLGGEDVEGTTEADVIRSIAQFRADQERVTTLSRGSYGEVTAALADNPAYRDTVELLETYVETGELDTAEVVETVSARPEPNLDTAARATTDALTARSDELIAEAEARRRSFIALSLAVLLAGGLFMLLAARSITRPLLSLTRQADAMASERLPAAVQEILDTPVGEDVVIPEVEPVTVKTRDEVREVAQALNTVQTSAVDLAVEQAVLRRNIADSFVNLGRRTQILIGRQLDFITELERNETDPDVLDDLFTLDHLATRARRNAESLVVLAGLATPRTWSAPIAMADVVRAALSEVEDYQRVEVRAVDGATVPGRTATDLVHLLAELLENGLSFSPPGRTVEVHGRHHPQRLPHRRHRPGDGDDRGGAGPGQPAPGRRGVLHRRPVALPRALRGGEPGPADRGHRHPGGVPHRGDRGQGPRPLGRPRRGPRPPVARRLRRPSPRGRSTPMPPPGPRRPPPPSTACPKRVRPPTVEPDPEPAPPAVEVVEAADRPDPAAGGDPRPGPGRGRAGVRGDRGGRPAGVRRRPRRDRRPRAAAPSVAAETRAARADLWRSYGPRRATDPVPTTPAERAVAGRRGARGRRGLPRHDRSSGSPPSPHRRPTPRPRPRPPAGPSPTPTGRPPPPTGSPAGCRATAWAPPPAPPRSPGAGARRRPRTPTAGPAPPADSAAADSMFSLLSSFETGMQRGRSELDPPTDEADPPTGASPDDSEAPS